MVVPLWLLLLPVRGGQCLKGGCRIGTARVCVLVPKLTLVRTWYSAVLYQPAKPWTKTTSCNSDRPTDWLTVLSDPHNPLDLHIRALRLVKGT